MLHVSRARGADTIPWPFPYGKIPKRGNNHPCGKPTRQADAHVPEALRPERAESRPERAVSAPRKADRPQPNPKMKPTQGDRGRSSKIGNGSSPGGSRKRGAGRSKEVEQSLFWRGKTCPGPEPACWRCRKETARSSRGCGSEPQETHRNDNDSELEDRGPEAVSGESPRQRRGRAGRGRVHTPVRLHRRDHREQGQGHNQRPHAGQGDEGAGGRHNPRHRRRAPHAGAGTRPADRRQQDRAR